MRHSFFFILYYLFLAEPAMENYLILIGKQTTYMQNVDEHILVLLLEGTISKENIYVLTIILATRSITKKAIKYN